MRLIQAPEEIGERIMGHKHPEREVSRGYGSIDAMVELLAPWMAKVDPLNKARPVSEFEDDEATQ